MQMKRIGLLAVLFAAVAVQTAAARQPKGDTLVFTPQWMAQAQFAGYYVAEVKGFFQEEGVNVKIVHPSPTQSAMNRLRSNESQAISLQLCQALDLATGRMLYCNAGHDAPVLVGAGVGELPCDPNIPVGFMLEWVYTLQEAEKALANREQEPRKIIASMTEAVHQFVGEADQSDDLTMMAIQLTL